MGFLWAEWPSQQREPAMSDILSSLFHFETVCSELGVEPHPYIAKMLDKEKEASAL